MKTLMLVLIVAGLAAGCATAPAAPDPQMFQVPKGQVALLYADLKELYGRVDGLLTAACIQKRLTVDECGRLKEAKLSLAVPDALVRAELVKVVAPGASNTFDIGQLSSLIMKLAPLAAGL